jgi:hypothetical protein
MVVERDTGAGQLAFVAVRDAVYPAHGGIDFGAIACGCALREGSCTRKMIGAIHEPRGNVCNLERLF